ncbi:MAG: xanthine dehydrogenase accessory protein XdhC [Phyllobacterium sp.]|uniref:xanthine dehydrogenase accessory protein XdhC n=1 Tax=Phyllobacterium sp. TaxID=1871046 RepID=UPI0030F2FC04
MPSNRDDIRDFLNRRKHIILVEVKAADGSTPREAGAWMLVAPDCIFGTIGGGQLEYMAIDHARRSLQRQSALEALTIPLGPEIGQCCGGRVALEFKPVDRDAAATLVEKVDREIAQRPHVYVFGAGHVGDALAMALSLVPLRIILVDTREAELSASQVPGVETCLTAVPEALVRQAPEGSAFVILTHDHALDFLIAAEALSRRDASYVGMIGSKTKRATFRNWLAREVGRPETLERLVCPVGGTAVKDKRPQVIAALAAAEIMTSALNYHERNDDVATANPTRRCHAGCRGSEPRRSRHFSQ